MFFIFFLFLLLNFHVYAEPIEKTLHDTANLPPLKEGEGYLMVHINVEGTAPFIEFSKLKTKHKSFIKKKKQSYSEDYRISLKNIPQGLYFIPMLSGTYQVTKVNTPFYNLPYWIPTENDVRWRFSIDANAVNFIGELFIAKERGTKEVNAELINRFATLHEEIQNAVNELPPSFTSTIKINAGYRDDFLMELNDAAK